MRLPLVTFFFLFLSICSFPQELTENDLYLRTDSVSQLINSSKYIETLDLADEIINDYKQFPGKERYFTYLYLYKAGAYLSLGDIMLSRYCNNLALTYAEEATDISAGFVIRNNLAVIDIEQQDYQSCYDKCQDLINDPCLSLTEDQKGMVLNNIALCALKLDFNEVADSVFSILLPIVSAHKSYAHFDPNLTHRNYGLYLRKINRDEEAKGYLSMAVSGYSEKFGNNNFQTGQSFLYLGECYCKIGELDSAQICFDKAVNILDPDPHSLVFSQNEMIRIKAYRARAEFYYVTGRESLALMDIEMAVEKIRHIIESYAASESSYIVAQLVRPVFNLGIEILVRMFEQSGGGDFFYRAIQYSDEAKRMSLRAMNKINQKIEINNDVERVYRDFYATRQKISAVDSLSFDLSGLIEDHSINRKKVDSMIGYVAPTNMENDAFFRGSKVNTSMLIYHDFGDYYGLFSVTRNQCKYYKIAKTKDLLQAVRQIKRILARPRTGNYSTNDLDEFLHSSTYLYDKLLGPIGGIKNKVLNIQGDDELMGLPFGILINGDKLDKRNTASVFRDLPFFLCEHSISYIGSLILNEQKGRNSGNSICFIISEKDGVLLNTSSEYEIISEKFDSNVFSRYNIGCNVLHFSGISDVSFDKPERSQLNEKVGWQEVLGMDNKGKSIYLNSCQTGIGKYVEGEGMLSLGLAFLLSGANQVVETYWQIPDKQSSEIAGIFYNDGGFDNPARALRSSKIEYLKSSHQGYDHPYYWAGTIVRGGIDFPKANVGQLILIIFTLIFIFVGGFALLRQK
jgi:tetratricopeptide (TPR) repeat protein